MSSATSRVSGKTTARAQEGHWMVTALGDGVRLQHVVLPDADQWHDTDGWPMGWLRGAANARWRPVPRTARASRSAPTAPRSSRTRSGTAASRVFHT